MKKYSIRNAPLVIELMSIKNHFFWAWVFHLEDDGAGPVSQDS